MCTLVESNAKLGGYTNSPPVDKGMYQRLVQRLVYLSHTGPYIAYPMSLVSQFMHCLIESHMQTLRRILCYSKTASGKEILFRAGGGSLDMQGYTDADYTKSLMDRRSTIGYCMFLGGNLVSW